MSRQSIEVIKLLIPQAMIVSSHHTPAAQRALSVADSLLHGLDGRQLKFTRQLPGIPLGLNLKNRERNDKKWQTDETQIRKLRRNHVLIERVYPVVINTDTNLFQEREVIVITGAEQQCINSDGFIPEPQSAITRYTVDGWITSPDIIQLHLLPESRPYPVYLLRIQFIRQVQPGRSSSPDCHPAAFDIARMPVIVRMEEFTTEIRHSIERRHARSGVVSITDDHGIETILGG